MVMMPRHTPASFTHTTRVDRTYTAQERERDGRKKGYRDTVRVSRVHSEGGSGGRRRRTSIMAFRTTLSKGAKGREGARGTQGRRV